MGITPLLAELLIREHAHRPLPETVHLIGRQTIYLTLDQALKMIARLGVRARLGDVTSDRQTRGAQAHGTREYISDRTFFGLLGVDHVLAIDYTDYEGADILLNLNEPVPAEVQGTMEFIFGGSVLDNVFDVSSYLKNICSLLRVGGRLFKTDIVTQNFHPYCLVMPSWLMDYFIVNKFTWCQLYMTETSPIGFSHIYQLSADPDEYYSDFGPPRGALPSHVIVIAERGHSSTTDRTPIQDQYRSEPDKIEFRASLAAMSPDDHPSEFAYPTEQDLNSLGIRNSKSFRYLGIARGLSTTPTQHRGHPDDVTSIKGILVLQATYGGNCLGRSMTASAICGLYKGNVTEILAGLANGADLWEWTVDVQLLGDPAPHQGKDLHVLYVHGSDPELRLQQVYIEPEASGRTLVLNRVGSVSA